MSYRFLNISDHKEQIITEGLLAAGYTPLEGEKPRKGDVIVAWNRKSRNDEQITAFEKAGGASIIAENGYVGTDSEGKRLVALAFTGHLGRGRWHIGSASRWKNHNIEVKPWRKGGNEVVILAQRGIGFTSVDESWALAVKEELEKKYTSRKVRIRWHPGKEEITKLEDDIADAHAVVTYSSAAGIKAIVSGIPCIYAMNGWIGRTAATQGIENIQNPYIGDRDLMLHQVGWAQWTQEEIKTGEAFKTLREYYENSPLLYPR